tara:strand:- start:752 stop:2629 length:1878 start_codon:yes stop_codon:yes gene_type:complete
VVLSFDHQQKIYEMKTIKQLDSITINKIAAGEVIDRPASIIKELIENAIDADATKITVEIKDGGKQYIRITDNGEGIQQDDLPLAPIRHATSKINRLEDIYSIGSFGFRGEALSSICHCAQLYITSKTNKGEAYSIHAHQDQITTPKITTHNQGTSIEVKDLFHNLPVRQQFLKSAATELSYITDVIIHFCLINPSIDFVFINNEKERINTTGINDIADLIVLFYGKELKNKCAKVNFSVGSVTIQGYISDPTITFSNKTKQVIAINNRLIKNGLIIKAIQDSFRDLIPQRRFPMVVLNIFIEQGNVDVNVHPQKQDVKFLSPGFIYDVLPKAINLALQEKTAHTDVLSDFIEPDKVNSSNPSFDFSEPSFNTKTPASSFNVTGSYDSNKNVSEQIKPIVSYPEVYKKDPISKQEVENSFTLFSKNESTQTRTQQMNVEFFQLFKTYIAIKSNNGLYIVDQHAVHERILYEKIKDDFAQQSERQVLLMGEIIELTADLFPVFESNHDTLKNLNFIVENFGGNQISVREVPVAFAGASIKDLVLDILEQLKHIPHSSRNLTLDQKETLQRKACKAAIKAGQTLSEPEVKKLIQDFINSPQNFTCPHGRPLFLHYDKGRLESLFLRK